MVMYTLSKDFKYQRHYDVPRDMKLYDYVNSNLGKEFDDIYYMVSNIQFTYNFNLIGSLIIEEIKYGQAVDKIVEKLIKLYKVEYERIEKDVAEFINFLESKKIVINE